MSKLHLAITISTLILAILSASKSQFVHPRELLPLSIHMKSLGFKIQDSKQDWGRISLGFFADTVPIFKNEEQDFEAIGVHANSKFELQKNRPLKSLEGICEYPERFFNSRIRCLIKSEDVVLHKSEVLDKDNRVSQFNVNIDAFQSIELVVKQESESINGAHAVWRNLKSN